MLVLTKLEKILLKTSRASHKLLKMHVILHVKVHMTIVYTKFYLPKEE